ncbi:hypothetical protein [Demequina activiva]|uniref:DUF8094 domain-containing protein n=1 Tax=Demequina activiva TaxID=1582364 RepID=A0A919Q6W2_9MICO|nr:hypothetical protein [Demequina activiva]GIG55293.1 hypothetical protein Dac01nite_20450 [Demequina activiva]
MTTRVPQLAAVASLAALALAGCVSDVPAPVTSAPPLEASGALLDEQSARIIDQTMAELAAADSAEDTEALTDRVGGDVVTLRGVEYTLAAEEDGPAPTVLPAEMQAVYVSAAEEWPRTMATVSEQPSEDETPVVMLWVQEDVDTDYQLRHWAHMIPGATLPAMPGATTGAAQLALDADAVSPAPQEAIEAYAELLRAGPDSDLDATFAPDTYRERLFAARDTLTEAANEADGEYVETIQPDLEASYAMATADGGALVFAPLTISSTFTVEDATVSIDEADEPLLEGELDDTVKHRYLDYLVIYVPGSGETDALPAVVAAEHTLIKVSD